MIENKMKYLDRKDIFLTPREQIVLNFVLQQGIEPKGIKQHHSPDTIPRNILRDAHWIERHGEIYDVIIVTKGLYVHYGHSFLGQPYFSWFIKGSDLD
jgi:hypothetical protein